MNAAEIRSVSVYGGFEAHFKKIHRSGWSKVEVNGVVQLYESGLEAEIAAYQALMKHIFGDGIVRDGDKASSARSVAEQQFGKIFPGKGRKAVPVVRR